MPTKRELRETAEALRRILDSVDRGELDAPPGLTRRLDAAACALEALANPKPGGTRKEEYT
jgi:hypothetical protein